MLGFTPGPGEILVIGAILVLLLSGPSDTTKWVYSAGRWVAALQVQLDPPHPRRNVILCFCLFPGTLALALLLWR